MIFGVWGLKEEMGDKQVDDNVGVDVAFDAAVAILDHFFPDDAVTDFGDQVAPFLGAEGGLAFFAVKLDDGV